MDGGGETVWCWLDKQINASMKLIKKKAFNNTSIEIQYIYFFKQKVVSSHAVPFFFCTNTFF